MKIGVVSLGCAKNLVDSEKVMGLLRANHHQLVNDAADAEAIIINTCGFINTAKEESINTILEMAEYKQTNCRFLIVMGCLAQRYLADLQENLPEVDRFITLNEYERLPEIFSEIFVEPVKDYGKRERVISTKPWTAYLKIADGCSNRCSYCAIPLIRGPYRSLPLADLIDEARRLADQGVRELVLIAQDTTRYGVDLDGRYQLKDLLIELQAIEKLHWIRILYMYPDEITDELIYQMKALPKVLPYFDIPVQHGNDRMLLAMNRRGSIQSIEHTIDLIRRTFPLPALRTTMIVGYPNETAADFQDLIQFIRRIKWDRLGAFTYSHEEDTPAYQAADDVSESLKQRRLDELMLVQQEVMTVQNHRLIDTVLEVLIEGYDALKQHYRGRTVFSAPDGVDGIAFIDSDHELEIGNFYYFRITKADAYDLYGVVTE